VLKISFADINGNGLTDLILQIGPMVMAIDFHQRLASAMIPLPPDAYAPLPGLLIAIENGLGAKTEISYETTAQLARKALVEGRPWADPIPQVMQVVNHNASTGVPGVEAVLVSYQSRRVWSRISMIDPAWDGYERRFRGFREVTTTRIAPTAPTRSIPLHRDGQRSAGSSPPRPPTGGSPQRGA
jgi:hypothetical protein